MEEKAKPGPKPKAKVYAEAFQMLVGVDLIGSKMSMKASKNLSLEITPLGIMAHSQKSDRTILIPWTNIKGVEMLSEQACE